MTDIAYRFESSYIDGDDRSSDQLGRGKRSTHGSSDSNDVVIINLQVPDTADGLVYKDLEMVASDAAKVILHQAYRKGRMPITILVPICDGRNRVEVGVKLWDVKGTSANSPTPTHTCIVVREKDKGLKVDALWKAQAHTLREQELSSTLPTVAKVDDSNDLSLPSSRDRMVSTMTANVTGSILRNVQTQHTVKIQETRRSQSGLKATPPIRYTMYRGGTGKK